MDRRIRVLLRGAVLLAFAAACAPAEQPAPAAPQGASQNPAPAGQAAAPASAPASAPCQWGAGRVGRRPGGGGGLPRSGHRGAGGRLHPGAHAHLRRPGQLRAAELQGGADAGRVVDGCSTTAPGSSSSARASSSTTATTSPPPTSSTPSTSTVGRGRRAGTRPEEITGIEAARPVHRPHHHAHAPNPTLLANLASLASCPREAREQDGRRRRSASSRSAPGPYRFVEFVRGQRLVLDANPNYWRGQVTPAAAHPADRSPTRRRAWPS